RRTRSVRMPRTSSERMITTSRPAKATAAIVVIAYSAVAAPVSSVNSCAARLLVSGGRSFSFMCFFFLSRDASRPRLDSVGSGSDRQGRGTEHAEHQRRDPEQQERGQGAGAQWQQQLGGQACGADAPLHTRLLS